MHWKKSMVVSSFAMLAHLGEASAACDVEFDNVRAKGLTASMVRAFHPCLATERGPFLNAETEGDVPACIPVYPRELQGIATVYDYDFGGSCQVKLSSKLAKDCADVNGSNGEPLGLPSGACHVTHVKAKCEGILDGLDVRIDEDDSGWTVWTMLRASIDDEANGAMTVIDLPVSFEFDPPAGGAMKLKAVSAEPLQDLGVFLPPCTALQIVKMEIRDPDGNSFATMGLATIPGIP